MMFQLLKSNTVNQIARSIIWLFVLSKDYWLKKYLHVFWAASTEQTPCITRTLLVAQKVKRLRRDYAIAADTLIRLQLEKQIEQTEAELNELAQQLDDLERALLRLIK